MSESNPAVRRYRIITTLEMQQIGGDGQPVTIPAGTVANEVLWDGVSDWTPPTGTRVEPAE